MPVVSISTSQASKSALPLVMRSTRCVSWISMGLAKAALAENSAIPVNKPMREFMLATSEILRIAIRRSRLQHPERIPVRRRAIGGNAIAPAREVAVMRIRHQHMVHVQVELVVDHDE